MDKRNCKQFVRDVLANGYTPADPAEELDQEIRRVVEFIRSEIRKTAYITATQDEISVHRQTATCLTKEQALLESMFDQERLPVNMRDHYREVFAAKFDVVSDCQ